MTHEQDQAAQPATPITATSLLTHLEQARRIVQEEWPAWKRDALSQTTRPANRKPAPTT